MTTDYTPIELEFPDTGGLLNGEIRLVTKETGFPLRRIQQIIRLIQQINQTDDDDVRADLEQQVIDSGVDEADLLYALGRVALRRSGYEDTPENADRVSLVSDPKAQTGTD